MAFRKVAMGEARKTYRCFMRDARGRIGGVEEIEAACDAATKDRCLDLLHASVSSRAAEIWQLDRLAVSITVR